MPDTPPKPTEPLDPNRPIRRWDPREARAFHATLRRRPTASLVLALACIAGAAVTASGVVGESRARSNNRFRRLALTTFWGLGAVYFGAWAVLGWRDRRGSDRQE